MTRSLHLLTARAKEKKTERFFVALLEQVSMQVCFHAFLFNLHFFFFLELRSAELHSTYRNHGVSLMCATGIGLCVRALRMRVNAELTVE